MASPGHHHVTSQNSWSNCYLKLHSYMNLTHLFHRTESKKCWRKILGHGGGGVCGCSYVFFIHGTNQTDLRRAFFSTLSLERKGQHFAEILKRIFVRKSVVFSLTFHWNLFIVVHLKRSHHWFRWCLGTDQAISHNLNECWTYMFHYAVSSRPVSRPQNTRDSIESWNIFYSIGFPSTKTD